MEDSSFEMKHMFVFLQQGHQEIWVQLYKIFK